MGGGEGDGVGGFTGEEAAVEAADKVHSQLGPREHVLLEHGTVRSTLGITGFLLHCRCQR